MRILVACEFSGVVREAFSALGHEAESCDLLPTEIPGNHYQGDIRDILYNRWDLMVAHPPCTRLCNSGVRWLAERNLWQEMREAAEFFKLIMSAPIKKKAIENPIPHKYALEIIGRKYDLISSGMVKRKLHAFGLKIWINCNLPITSKAGSKEYI